MRLKIFILTFLFIQLSDFGGNFIIIIPNEEMVIVTGWLKPSEIVTFIKQVLNALP